MELVGSGFNFKSIFKTFNNTTTPEKWGTSYFYPLGMEVDLYGNKDYLKDFLEVPEVNAILNMRARALSNAVFTIRNIETGKESTNYPTLARVLRAPNWYQSQKELYRLTSLYRDIYGNEYLYLLTPVGLPNNYKGMFTLDPTNVEVEYKNEAPYFLDPTGESVKYFYKIGGKRIPLDSKSIVHLNDNRVKSTNFLLGTSKLEALQPAISNIRAAYKKRGIILNMPIGVLSSGKEATAEALPMTPDEKAEAQKELKIHGAHPILTNLHLDYNSLEIDARKMGLYTEVEEDIKKICDSYGVPFDLLANSKGRTYDNVKEGKKQFYEDTIIPDQDERTGAINQKIDIKNIEIVSSYSHLAVFAEDVKARAETIKLLVESLDKLLASGIITKEEYKAELNKFNIGK